MTIPSNPRRMHIAHVIPILNVSNIQESFAWFEKFGWVKAWEWGEPPDFGGVHLGQWQIYLCQDGQGGRGKSHLATTFGPGQEDRQGNGVWIWLAVDDVDAINERCLTQGLEVTWPPTDMPWNAREMHVRHPDGHVFRLGQGIKDG